MHVAAGREDAVAHREEIDEHDRQHEVGNGEQPERCAGGDLVDRRISPVGGEQRQGNRQGKGHELREHDQLEGDREALADDRAHRLVVAIRPAEVPACDLAQPVGVAHGQRPVEEQVVAHALDLTRAGPPPQDDHGRVPGQERREQEREQRHQEQDSDQPEELLEHA